MENCLFCKIVSGQIPSYKVWEDEENFAFLDIMPIKAGHTLVIPKKHFPYLFEMTDPEYTSLLNSSKIIAEILKRAFNPKTGKIGAVVYGLDIDHTHLHLIPIDKTGDLNFSKKKPVAKQELEKSLAKIKQ